MSTRRRLMMANSNSSSVDWEEVYTKHLEHTLTDVTIPSGVTSIGSYAFYYQKSLVSVTIPSSVTSLSTDVFNNCTSLTSVTYEGSAPSFGRSVFNACNAITDISSVLPTDATDLGYQLFPACLGLTNVVIPDGITSIGAYPFRYCTKITSMTFPSSLTYISSLSNNSLSALAELIFEGSTPPTLTTVNSIEGTSKTFPIYVPDDAVDTYKAASVWSNFSSRIYAISERTT